MFTLESLLASKFISKRELKKIKDLEIILDDDKENIFLVYKYLIGTNKEGEDKYRLYKNNITKMVSEHGGLENLFKTLVAAEMMVHGYLIIPIDGGWICTGGSETYSMKQEECTCQAYTVNPSKPCKHLIYKEALLLQRSRMNEWKRANL